MTFYVIVVFFPRREGQWSAAKWVGIVVKCAAYRGAKEQHM